MIVVKDINALGDVLCGADVLDRRNFGAFQVEQIIKDGIKQTVVTSSAMSSVVVVTD